jgi:hypothetical protein
MEKIYRLIDLNNRVDDLTSAEKEEFVSLANRSGHLAGEYMGGREVAEEIKANRDKILDSMAA